MTREESDIPLAAVAVDLVVLTIRDGDLQALTVRRRIPPYQGRWVLPGGFVLPDEDLAEAAARELVEETGLAVDVVHLEQLATYGAPRRDPRLRVVSVAYLVLAPDLPSPVAGSDAAAARWMAVDQLLAAPRSLAFDHLTILRHGVERARAKLEYTDLGTVFCPREFTIGELRRVYEIVWGTPLDPRNFHRKVSGTPGLLQETGETTTRDGGRPARLYRRGVSRELRPPIYRT